ncbi:hypothetical protein BEL04_14445 [Mucilaginibacter sp. PPCGB 2223]|uniref:hypothetical protein n=1 Tax=Mucilaginibacter sp. PPCGB 2223 TaxID=1886027 RepID=UPI000826A461|nr:hypothetical protein [Mucilaginibacter sp. PPCGB 2223]OCX52642.1 hypothetical protein BEL04_14445 [Mucilaginibacter sp. PPCGB 2223]
MKYAFVLGSNAYIANQGVITFFEDTQEKEFLRVRSVFKPVREGNTELAVNIHIKNREGYNIDVLDNKTMNSTRIDDSPGRFKVFNTDGSTLIDVHQLEKHDYMHLSHHITAELERYEHIAVIRVFGHFMVGDHRISIDNEKLFIDNESFAESVLIGQGGVQLRADGVLL